MRFLTVFLATMLAATQASAHAGIGMSSGMAAGFLHPLAGLDHILAMAAVGLFATQPGGRALWLVPAAFLAMMAVGGALGAFGASLPLAELGIALSIVVFGGMITLSRSLPLAAAVVIIGLFAVFHGHAHGTEMPAAVSGLTFGLGFMVASALLIGAGIVAGVGLGKVGAAQDLRIARMGGAALSAIGVVFLAGQL